MTSAATIPARAPGTSARSMASPRDTPRTSAMSVSQHLAPTVVAAVAMALLPGEGRPPRPPAHLAPAPRLPVQLPRLLLAEQTVGKVVLVLLADGAANLGDDRRKPHHEPDQQEQARREESKEAEAPSRAVSEDDLHVPVPPVRAPGAPVVRCGAFRFSGEAGPVPVRGRPPACRPRRRRAPAPFPSWPDAARG